MSLTYRKWGGHLKLTLCANVSGHLLVLRQHLVRRNMFFHNLGQFLLGKILLHSYTAVSPKSRHTLMVICWLYYNTEFGKMCLCIILVNFYWENGPFSNITQRVVSPKSLIAQLEAGAASVCDWCGVVCPCQCWDQTYALLSLERPCSCC